MITMTYRLAITSEGYDVLTHGETTHLPTTSVKVPTNMPAQVIDVVLAERVKLVRGKLIQQERARVQAQARDARAERMRQKLYLVQ